jgi:hypothetical protein
MRTKLKIITLWLLTASCLHACAQNTVFTYQGRVTDSGTNFTGAGLFKFALLTSTNNSHTATATANISAPFVTGYNVTYGGSGYSSPPNVTVSGGGGSGATATASLTGGVVTSITPGSAGTGYTSTPTVSIDPPPPAITYTTYWSNDGTGVAGSEPASAVGVAVNDGLFTVALGDATLANMAAISASLFNQPDLQLRIWFNDGVNGSSVLSPVQNLSPAPNAIYAESAGTVPASQLSGMLTLAQLPGGVVTNNAASVTLTNLTLNGELILPFTKHRRGHHPFWQRTAILL